MAVYFTASHPDRVRALILYGTFARLDPVHAAKIAEIFDVWGTGRAYGLVLSHPPDPVAAERVLARYERSACTPQMCREILQRNSEIDVTSMLPMISAPTLVMHCSDDPLLGVEHGRYVWSHIPGARYVEIDGDLHGSWRREGIEKLWPPVAEFLRDVLGEGESMARSVGDRELATVLFTDFVASTERAARVGDSVWRAILDQHDLSASELIANAGGRLVKTTGDGLLATFRGPSPCGHRREVDPGRGARPWRRRTGRIAYRRDRATRGRHRRDRCAHRRADLCFSERRRDSRVAHGARSSGRVPARVRRSWDPRTQGYPEQWQLFAVR